MRALFFSRLLLQSRVEEHERSGALPVTIFRHARARALWCTLLLGCAPRSEAPQLAHTPLGPPIAVWRDGDELVVLPLRSGTLSLVEGEHERPIAAGRIAIPHAASEVRWHDGVSGARYVLREAPMMTPPEFVSILPHRLGDGLIVDEALRIR